MKPHADVPACGGVPFRFGRCPFSPTSETGHRVFIVCDSVNRCFQVKSRKTKRDTPFQPVGAGKTVGVPFVPFDFRKTGPQFFQCAFQVRHWSRAGALAFPEYPQTMTEHAGTYTARVTFRELLEARGLTAYRVALAGRGTVSRNAVYALARGEAERVDLGTLGKLAGVLEQLTGEPVAVAELLTLERTS